MGDDYEDLEYWEETPIHQEIWPLFKSILKHIILRILYMIYFTTLFTHKSPRLVAAVVEDISRIIIYTWKNWYKVIRLFVIYIFYAPFAFVKFMKVDVYSFLYDYIDIPYYYLSRILNFFLKITFFFLLFFLPCIYLNFFIFYNGFYCLSFNNYESHLFYYLYYYYFLYLVIFQYLALFYFYYIEFNIFQSFWYTLKFYFFLFYLSLKFFLSFIGYVLSLFVCKDENDPFYAYLIFSFILFFPLVIFTQFGFVWVMFWLFYLGHTYYMNEPDESDYVYAVGCCIIWTILIYLCCLCNYFPKVWEFLMFFNFLFYHWFCCNAFFQYLRAREYILQYIEDDPEEDEECFEEEWTYIQEGLFWDQVVIEYCTDRLAEGDIPMEDVLEDALDLKKILQDPIFFGMTQHDAEYKPLYATFNKETGELEIDESVEPKEMHFPERR